MISHFVNHLQCYKTFQFPLKALCFFWASPACFLQQQKTPSKQKTPKQFVLLMSHFWFLETFLISVNLLMILQVESFCPCLLGWKVCPSTVAIYITGARTNSFLHSLLSKLLKLVSGNTLFHIRWKLLHRSPSFIPETTFSKQNTCQKD